jgi:plasmid stabilization system protein ParE
MFTVRWKPAALKELTEIWNNVVSAMRLRITAVTHQIEQGLQRSADTLGESRPGGRRIWFVSPLGVRYHVDLKSSIVRVLHVWQIRR